MKDKIINDILRAEGGYVNDPNDSGGETNFGITKKVIKSLGYTGEVRNIPRALAFDIYADKYWNSVRADEMPESVAAEVVDTAVNMGVSRSGKILQRSLNILGNVELVIDGMIGPGTISALNEYLSIRDEKTLVKALNCLQGSFYIELAERREKDKRFIYGWLKNRVAL